MRRVGGMVAAVGVLAGCGVVPQSGGAAASATPETTVLEDAAQTCSSRPDEILGDGGASLTLDTKGTGDADGHDFADVRCVLGEISAPDYVREHIESTRALDGQQTDQWGDIEARWTYHPDSGLRITLIDRS